MLIEAVQTNVFNYWDLENHNIPDPSSINISLMISQSDTITAVYNIGDDTQIVINEINYHSADEFDSGDWVELYNSTNEILNIGNWIFKDEDDEHIFLIPDTFLDFRLRNTRLCRMT